jgi:hypothetical protein
VYEACTAELEKNDVFALDSPMFQRNINGIESTGGLVSDFHGDNRGSNPLRDAILQSFTRSQLAWGRFGDTICRIGLRQIPNKQILEMAGTEIEEQTAKHADALWL